ncbi:MAG: hypothetical protein VX891_03870, partial [Candidatus Thermoplasmatota archaeon]|nr:hypothetical protein [Candidatus Thermoplasmatota archaeon]
DGPGRLALAVGVGILAVACLGAAGPVEACPVAEGPAGACLVEADLAEACPVAASGRSPAASCPVGACPAAEGLVAGSLGGRPAAGNLPSVRLPCWVERPAPAPEHRWCHCLDVRHIQGKTWSHPEWILHTLRTAWCNLIPAPQTCFLKASSALLGNKAT